MLAPAPPARRVGARVVDLVLLAWLWAVVVVEIEGRLLGGDPLARRIAQPVTDAEAIVGLLAVLVLLEVLPTALAGRSPGKALLGLRVVALRGVDELTPPGFLRSLGRAAVLFLPVGVPYVGFALATLLALASLLSPHGRGLHDRGAGTLVVAAPFAGAKLER